MFWAFFQNGDYHHLSLIPKISVSRKSWMGTASPFLTLQLSSSLKITAHILGTFGSRVDSIHKELSLCELSGGFVEKQKFYIYYLTQNSSSATDAIQMVFVEIFTGRHFSCCCKG